ncbi:hypothetical protein E2562_025091 [Oryza meyeriana var. granulata]|uniref:Uncharacterized protein n=1 Tax=Oryza meyeriana var. granulata TaxID=110450 RepID=A0A6G1D7M6_9ORYZ|nr:hypothetical protein E2562_025091 [Oryza meyeriana var. granulata]
MSKAAVVGPKLVVPPPLEREKAPPKESALTIIDADQKQHPPRPAKAKVKPTDPKHPHLKKATTLAPTSKPDQNILQTFGKEIMSRYEQEKKKAIDYMAGIKSRFKTMDKLLAFGLVSKTFKKAFSC